MLDLFFDAAWKVLIAGLVFGAGIPVLFAAGIRFSAAGASDGTAAPAAPIVASRRPTRRSTARSSPAETQRSEQAPGDSR